MANRITRLKTQEINEYGHTCAISGVWDDKPFFVHLFAEYDGRDVDCETPRGGFNPMYEDPEFFITVCENKQYQKLHNEGYKTWEKLAAS